MPGYLKDGFIIEKTRELDENEFIFRDSFVIGSDDIWQVFNYISENSSVVIEKMSEENIIPTRWQDHKVFGIRITKKSDLND
jgi:hypothetical protein|tara:strand:- start:120 stop:365 length:246 start_codon:yes stop_codon:yes gene_type:complete